MSKFGLDENDVKNIVEKIIDTHVKVKYGNTLAMVQNNRKLIDRASAVIDRASAVDPRVPILISRIKTLEKNISRVKTLEKNMDDMRSDIALLIERINTLS